MRGSLAIRGSLIAAILAAASAPATGGGISTPWVDGHGSRARLLAGAAGHGAGQPETFAGLEVAMAQGWKTYWRTPGDSGGLAPHFDWTASSNLAAVRVLYPAPRRFRDALGDSVGYAGSVVFPVEIRAKDPAKPVELRLSVEYGVCREICVPAEASLALSIPAGATVSDSAELTAALARVPRAANARVPHDPELRLSEAHLSGDKPRLVLEVEYPGATGVKDLFIEAPDGLYVPLPVKTGERAGVVRFEVDLTQGAEPGELRGKTLLVTMVSDAGQSEATWTLQ